MYMFRWLPQWHSRPLFGPHLINMFKIYVNYTTTCNPLQNYWPSSPNSPPPHPQKRKQCTCADLGGRVRTGSPDKLFEKLKLVNQNLLITWLSCRKYRWALDPCAKQNHLTFRKKKSLRRAWSPWIGNLLIPPSCFLYFKTKQSIWYKNVRWFWPFKDYFWYLLEGKLCI